MIHIIMILYFIYSTLWRGKAIMFCLFFLPLTSWPAYIFYMFLIIHTIKYNILIYTMAISYTGGLIFRWFPDRRMAATYGHKSFVYSIIVLSILQFYPVLMFKCVFSINSADNVKFHFMMFWQSILLFLRWIETIINS